jgi:predicted signal transduction protein with EAL and GGDEF domain
MDSQTSPSTLTSVPPPAPRSQAPSPVAEPSGEASKTRRAPKAAKTPKAAKAPKAAKPAGKGLNAEISFKLPKLSKRTKAPVAPEVVPAEIFDIEAEAPVAAPFVDTAPPAYAAPPVHAEAAIVTDDAARAGLNTPLTAPSPTTIGLLVGFVVGYVILSMWGLQLRDANGVTPWFPAAGLAVAAVTLGGRQFLPATFVASLIASAIDGGDPSVWFALSVIMTVGYGTAGLVLRRVLDPARPLTRVSDAWWLIGVAVVAAPLLVSLVFTGAIVALGTIPASAYGDVVRPFLLGDALGVTSVAPGMLVAVAGFRRYGLRGALPGRDFLKPEALGAILLLLALTPAVYLGGGADLRALATLPLCWLALRFGVPGAVLGGFAWSASSALLLSTFAQDETFSGLQAFLLTGTMLAVIVGTVVSERERDQRELRHLAMHDGASGLPNETRLLELLDHEIVTSRGREITMLVIRFAGLRQVATALGNSDIDNLVGLLTTRLAAISGGEAQLARPAFDRFAILTTSADQHRRQAIAEQLIEELTVPLAVDSREVFVDPRVGITVCLPGEQADAVLAHADHAADIASAADGKRIAYYDAAIERAHRDRVELTEDLRVATERGEFLLAFQPIVTAKEGRVVAAEALLRWVDKKRGPVSPMDFIPVAESTGLILPIGRWVLNEACRRAAAWPHVAGQPIDVSVNVSPIQLMDEGFVDDVRAALEHSHLAASRLRIEITEGIVLEDIERTILRINQLKEMGVETMLDDFGTGHSSLAWVQRLPVSCIKIDRAFVNDIAVDGIDRAIVHASLYLSRALGTETIAEGVETEAQREQLIRMGCQKLQGYLFARPQPADVFPDWLAKQRAAVESGRAPHRAAAPVSAAGARAISGPSVAGGARAAGVAAAPMPRSRAAVPTQEYAVAAAAPQYAAAAAAPPQYLATTAAPAPAPVAPAPIAAPAPQYAAAPVAPAPQYAAAPVAPAPAAPYAPAPAAPYASAPVAPAPHAAAPAPAPHYAAPAPQQAPPAHYAAAPQHAAPAPQHPAAAVAPQYAAAPAAAPAPQYAPAPAQHVAPAPAHGLAAVPDPRAAA